jgi:SHS2 domain-containing protein
MKYKFFEHTADIGVEAVGSTIEEAFSNTALGLENIITDTSKVEEKTERPINLESEDLKSLLYDFLEQFLVLFDSEELFFSRIEVKSIKGQEGKYSIEAIAYGEKYNPDKHESKTHVKAVTYHQMKVEEKEGKHIIHVLFDI